MKAKFYEIYKILLKRSVETTYILSSTSSQYTSIGSVEGAIVEFTNAYGEKVGLKEQD